MTDDAERIYQRLRARLAIDPMALDDELVELPGLIIEAGEQTALAINRRDIAKSDLDLAFSEGAAMIRASGEKEGKKPAEKQIESEVPRGRKYRAALKRWEDAKLECGCWMALVEALRAKGSSLKTTAELTLGGYLAPNAVYHQRREDMHNARIARREQHRAHSA